MASQKFSSEGFDLDALASAVPEADSSEVIYELGGKVVRVEEKQEKSLEEKKEEGDRGKIDYNPLSQAEELKQQGNAAFQTHDWQSAYDLYSQAIESVPYNDENNAIRGKQLLKLRDDWQMEQNKLARQKLVEKEERERLKRQRQKDGNGSAADDENKKEEEAEKPAVFEPPVHPFADNLSVYHCNRAAALLHLHNNSQSTSQETTNDLINEAVQDCDIALLLKSDYVKAYVRRSTAFEHLDQTDKALADAKEALQLLQKSKNPQNANQLRSVQQTVQRLQRIEDERLEKLKTETLDKLKDLGNSILGNFGLSLDNFKATQDPKTGGYSISFNNGNNSGGGAATS